MEPENIFVARLQQGNDWWDLKGPHTWTSKDVHSSPCLGVFNLLEDEVSLLPTVTCAIQKLSS